MYSLPLKVREGNLKESIIYCFFTQFVFVLLQFRHMEQSTGDTVKVKITLLELKLLFTAELIFKSSFSSTVLNKQAPFTS